MLLNLILVLIFQGCYGLVKNSHYMTVGMSSLKGYWAFTGPYVSVPAGGSLTLCSFLCSEEGADFIHIPDDSPGLCHCYKEVVFHQGALAAPLGNRFMARASFKKFLILRDKRREGSTERFTYGKPKMSQVIIYVKGFHRHIFHAN